MPKLINADALWEQIDSLIKPSSTEEAIIFQQVLALIEDAQTIDAVPVVRCKDCWIFHQDETWNPKAGLCEWFDRPVGINDFCSNGEREEDVDK